MTYTIRWKDCDRSDAVTSHIEQKIAKFEDFKFVIPESKIEIVFYQKRNNFKTRINLPVKVKGVLRVEAESDDILTSINLASEKMLDQLRRVKTKFNRDK